ncbi:MAG: hypothetical protein ABIZ80_03705 [Bryobacteraceae bacterium]
MPTLTKAEASRANGAKSKGPKSEETREKVSQNAIQHGLTATSRHNILLACEPPEEFQEMCDEYKRAYLPVGLHEEDLVRDMIAARWRIRRLWIIEATLIDDEMMSHEQELSQQRPELDGATHLALAFRRLTDESRTLALISRYESRLHRLHERSLRSLRESQQARQPQPVTPEVPSAPAKKKCETNLPVPQDPVAEGRKAGTEGSKPAHFPIDRQDRTAPGGEKPLSIGILTDPRPSIRRVLVSPGGVVCPLHAGGNENARRPHSSWKDPPLA